MGSLCGAKEESVTGDSSPQGFKTPKMPENSLFYDKVLPVALAVLGVITVALVLFAVGVLTGVIAWH
jgi:hypothetical protein